MWSEQGKLESGLGIKRISSSRMVRWLRDFFHHNPLNVSDLNPILFSPSILTFYLVYLSSPLTPTTAVLAYPPTIVLSNLAIARADSQAIQHRHPYEDVRDTALYYALRKLPNVKITSEGQYPSLKTLCREVLGMGEGEFQKGEHCPVSLAR
jgi:hypothetical protein